MNCQIVHDSIHRRAGWMISYIFEIGGVSAGFGSVAIGGPWKEKHAILEYYISPAHRNRAFAFFELLMTSSGARFFEAQSNEALFSAMALTYATDVASESIVFQDGMTSNLAVVDAVLRAVTDPENVVSAIEERQGGGEWVIEVDGTVVGKGGILFHYNRPYGDIYMEIEKPMRQRGFGSYLVQELKREAYKLGAIPCARCSPANVPSRKTLQRAGFVPFAHMLTGSLRAP
ncbi:MAG TPA: GNAT family N-acetyltransferase [Verrucomicrobiae bacterium]|nr:GNAT family N-acetyltransferase [Verrucomicrobiae bacterium]